LLSLRAADGAVADDLAPRLRQRLNQPCWPPVTVATSQEDLSCSAETWEPILRVRIEDALVELLGPTWEDIVTWHDGAGWRAG
jgi:hypothetical protein